MPSVGPPSVLYAHYGFCSGPHRFGTRPFNSVLDKMIKIFCALSIIANIFLAYVIIDKSRQYDYGKSFINQVDPNWIEVKRIGHGIGPFVEYSVYQFNNGAGISYVTYMDNGRKMKYEIPSDSEYIARCAYDGKGDSLVVILKKEGRK